MRSRLIRLLAILTALTTLVAPAQAGPTDHPLATTAQTVLPDPATEAPRRSSPGLRVVSAPHISGLVGSSRDSRGRQTYLVQLADAPLATYQGEIAGLAPTNPAARGLTRLAVDSPESRRYLSYLAGRQDAWLASAEMSLGRPVLARYRFQHALNGLALRLTPEEAGRLARMPGVLRVEADRAYRVTTDAGPAWIGATSIWDGSATGGLPATQGEGVIIGVIDSGVNMDHPSFADVGGDGFNHTNPNGPGVYRGWCDPANPNYSPAYVCNDKLVGAWDFADASWAGESDGPEDNNGHGSHTASTAAGNVLTATLQAPTTVISTTISGVAPHANLIAYDVCGPTGFCNSSDVIAAINQAVADGVDVINESISIGGDPFTGLKQAAYWNAYAAGIVVARSAGNDGPLAGTVGPEPPWAISSGASTHNRQFVNTLVNLTSGGASLADIAGAGLTSGYGPRRIVHARDAGDALCLFPFPAGTWTNGEIVVCQRGAVARTLKGDHVKAGGAGGMVLANTSLEGESLAADPHSLPAVHIGYSDALALDAWMTNPANSNPKAAISGSYRDLAPMYGDQMADFSSRGPGRVDVLKPDLSAPGVSILAAIQTTNPSDPPEYGFLSGTSMASPHTAGAAALLRALHPTWTPGQIRAALMSTSQEAGIRKEDGLTSADPFDRGAGRIDLTQAARAGLVLDVTAAQFAAADPGAGGDPRTLNLPSMQDSSCYQQCLWTRTVKNPTSQTMTWQASYSGDGVATITPNSLTLSPGQSRSFDLTLDISGLPTGAWYFGSLVWSETGSQAPDAHLPVAAYSAMTSDPSVLTKEVSAAASPVGSNLTYTITLQNTGTATQSYTLKDPLPAGVAFLSGSATGGLGYDSGVNSLSWTGSLAPLDLTITGGTAPFGYDSLAAKGVPPAGCPPSDCDDGGWIITGLDSTYFGTRYIDAIWSVNGTLELGTASNVSTPADNTPLPATGSNNNLLAPWWTNLDLSSAGNWYLATLTDGTNDYDVFEWEDAPLASNPAKKASFQIWLQRGGDQIWFTYKTAPGVFGDTATIGAENHTGTIGDQFYFNGSGSVPDGTQELILTSGPQSVFTFQAQMTPPGQEVVNEVTVTDGAANVEKAAARTRVRSVYLPQTSKR